MRKTLACAHVCAMYKLVCTCLFLFLFTWYIYISHIAWFSLPMFVVYTFLIIFECSFLYAYRNGGMSDRMSLKEVVKNMCHQSWRVFSQPPWDALEAAVDGKLQAKLSSNEWKNSSKSFVCYLSAGWSGCRYHFFIFFPPFSRFRRRPS